MNRYNIIHQKFPREILLLRGKGCFWSKCSFCDYHHDKSLDQVSNTELNACEFKKITGLYKRLETINSGSFNELSDGTIEALYKVCLEKDIHDLHMEYHYSQRNHIKLMKEKFHFLELHCKTGVETFDNTFRENVLKKGIGLVEPEEIRRYFEDCCLLVGVLGQTQEQISSDIQIALKYFNRVCVNVFVENTTRCKRDPLLVDWFLATYGDSLSKMARVDLLVENTDFGVG